MFVIRINSSAGIRYTDDLHSAYIDIISDDFMKGVE